MQVSEITYDSAVPIDGYGPGFLRVGGTVVHGPVIVTATGTKSWAGPDDTAALVALAGQADVILFGAGETLQPVPPALTAAIEDAGMGIEPMPTPSACRAYNILLAEGRRVALAAVPI